MPSPKPTCYSPEEARALFFDRVAGIKQYWLSLPGKTEEEKMDGFIFSLFVLFDGGSMDWPAMDISMSPHPKNKAYQIKNGERWFKAGQVINQTQLHEEWCARRNG